MENYRELIEEKLDNVILQHSYSRNREKRVDSEYVEFVDWLVEELSKAKKEIVFTDEELEVIEYNLRGIQDVLGGIEDEILESILGKIDSLSKLKDNK